MVFGVKYGDGEGNVFWIKGIIEGVLLLKGEVDCNCIGLGGEDVVLVLLLIVVIGMVFCVIGNELGWLVVVVDGVLLYLWVEIDYG